MRDIVRREFYEFNRPMEGEVPFFYQDVKGLVSIGVGLLCDPIHLALGLPMMHEDGRLAQRDEIAAEWLRVKNLPPNAKGQTAAQLGHLYAKPYTKLRLTPDGLRRTLEGKLHQMDTFLAKRFPEYEEWPADAQLGVLSLSWACGPAFRFPKCEAALRAWDFRKAAVECFMPEEKTISGLRPRNIANRTLFLNAAHVVELGLSSGHLFWPRALATDPLGPDDDTLEDPIRPDQLEAPAPIIRPKVVHLHPTTGKPLDPDDEPPAAA